MHLYDSNIPSGNAYKVQLLLSHLGIEYKTTVLDIMAKPSETRTPEFLSINPSGRIPVLVLDDGTALAESNAIIYYLAEDTKFLPDTKLGRTQVLQWLFFEQNLHEPYIAVWKYNTYWGGFANGTESQNARMKQRGQDALQAMERHLEGKKFFVGDAYSIADIALFAYTTSAEAIGFEVGSNIKAWLERVEGQEGWVKIKKDPTGKCPL